MIGPARIGHVFLGPQGRTPVLAWGEGGGRPIVRAPEGGLDELGSWALAYGAVAVLVRRQFDSRVHWWGPGRAIPFNKLEVEPLSALAESAHPWVRPPSPALGAGPYLAFWADRAWSSLHADEGERRRALFDGELVELFPDPETRPASAEEVRVWRHDMFGERPPHLRGFIRSREVLGVESWSTDAEDAANPYFHAGPPPDAALEDIARRFGA